MRVMDLIVTTASRLISLVFFFALRIPRVFYPLSPVARCLAPVNVNSYSPPAPHYAFILCWPYLSRQFFLSSKRTVLKFSLVDSCNRRSGKRHCHHRRSEHD